MATTAVRSYELSESRTQYVRRFVASQGFDPSTLPEEHLPAFFRILARVDEHETLGDGAGPTSRRRVLPESEIGRVDMLSRNIEKPFPEIDARLRELSASGRLKRVADPSHLWPDGKRFAVVLTHDVDSLPGVRLMPRLRAVRVIPGAPARRKIILALSAAKGLTRTLLPFWRYSEGPFESWLEEEARYGFRSSFFFFAGSPPVRNWRDAFYRQSDRIVFEGRKRRLSTVMRQIADRGWDVGLHGSASSWSDPDRLRKERATLQAAVGRQVRTTRQHHLLFDVRRTPAYQADAGFEADTTLGSNSSVGFRCGTCFPFRVFDLSANRELDLLEVPLIIQEAALLRQEHWDETRAYRLGRDLMEQVAAMNGVLTLLWHNNVPRSSPQFRIYAALLAEAHRRGAWGCSLAQINDWWRKRLAGL